MWNRRDAALRVDNSKTFNKKLKIILLMLIVILAVVLLIFNSNISGSIGARIKEIVGASSIETRIDYKIEQLIGNKLEIYVTINNERGIEKVVIVDKTSTY